MIEIGITERGDAAIDESWIKYIQNGGYAILITKDPLRLFEIIHTKLTDNECRRVIIHCTITGYAHSWIEPNVPILDDGTFETELSSPDGISTKVAKLVLRVDPIIPTEIGLKKALKVIDKWCNYFDEIRISFIDNYKHLRERGIKMPWDTLHAPLELRRNAYNEILKHTNKKIVCICGEPDFKCTGCVSESDLKAFGININEAINGGYQRYSCCCIANKKELLKIKHPCKHNCVYCYWKN